MLLLYVYNQLHLLLYRQLTGIHSLSQSQQDHYQLSLEE